jgi:hypothetical protein
MRSGQINGKRNNKLEQNSKEKNMKNIKFGFLTVDYTGYWFKSPVAAK